MTPQREMEAQAGEYLTLTGHSRLASQRSHSSGIWKDKEPVSKVKVNKGVKVKKGIPGRGKKRGDRCRYIK